MADFVLSKSKVIVGHNGEQFRLYEDELWAADDPLVKAHPELFTRTPAKVRRSAPAPVVEEATAEPGAKRRTRAR